jgi:hypothetical protein
MRRGTPGDAFSGRRRSRSRTPHPPPPAAIIQPAQEKYSRVIEMSEIFDLIGVLSERVSSLYAEIQRRDPSPQPLAVYCREGASRWVAEAAVSGRSLPVNVATLQALRCAVDELQAAVERSDVSV